MSRRSKRSEKRSRSAAAPTFPVFDDTDDEAAFWEAEGRRCAIEGMDLPDGAYFAMMEDAGLEP